MLTSARLQLRPWRDEDLPAFAALNADPEVMEYMPKCLAREESDALTARIREGLTRYGFGLWAVEVIGVSEFLPEGHRLRPHALYRMNREAWEEVKGET